MRFPAFQRVVERPDGDGGADAEFQATVAMRRSSIWERAGEPAKTADRAGSLPGAGGPTRPARRHPFR